MSIFEKIRGAFSKPDSAEWDANDPAGDPSLYKHDATAEYDHGQFISVAEVPDKAKEGL